MSKYEKVSSKIQEVTISNPKNRSTIRWVNIANPGKEELEYLMRFKQYNFDFRELRASSAKVMAERPTIEKKDKYFFLTLHFPVFEGKKISASEINFFISHGLLVTLHTEKIKTINDFFNICKKDEYSLLSYQLPSSAILLYELLKKLIEHCYQIMDQVNARLNDTEKLIFSGHQKKSVSEILEMRRNIIAIRRIMLNHKNILKKIMEMKSSIISSNKMVGYYTYLIEQTKRIWEFSESQKEVAEALHETNESFLDNQTNEVMKTLTVFSVIVFPLTLLAAIFGMNTTGGMPFMDNPLGFWIIMSMMGIGTLGMIIYFKIKKWL
jgi:magnesium transporter